jgi:hypothetical protein
MAGIENKTGSASERVHGAKDQEIMNDTEEMATSEI